MTSGLLIERVTLFGVSWELGWLSWPITAGWIVGLTNAFNLIDGLDGLAAGIAALAGATCGAILIVRGHTAEALLLAALVGAAIGFLVFNFAPASIFLGDSGSLLFGFLLATTAIAGWQKGATALATGVPLLMFALPIADIATTIVRRGLARPAAGRPSIAAALRQLVEPDRQHIHHRLLALGWSTERTVLILYAVTAVLSLLACRRRKRHEARPAGAAIAAAAGRQQRRGRLGAAGTGARASGHGAVLAAGRGRADQPVLRHPPAPQRFRHHRGAALVAARARPAADTGHAGEAVVVDALHAHGERAASTSSLASTTRPTSAGAASSTSTIRRTCGRVPTSTCAGITSHGRRSPRTTRWPIASPASRWTA